MTDTVLVMLNRPSAEAPPHDPAAGPLRFADPAAPYRWVALPADAAFTRELNDYLAQHPE